MLDGHVCMSNILIRYKHVMLDGHICMSYILIRYIHVMLDGHICMSYILYGYIYMSCLMVTYACLIYFMVIYICHA